MFPNDTYEITSSEQQDLVDKYIPLDKDKHIDQCHLKVFDGPNANFSLIKCDSWVYSRQYFEETLVTKVRTLIDLKKNFFFLNLVSHYTSLISCAIM